MTELSTKPYLIRAIHAWCSDSGYRPYIAVLVDERTIVPREYVRNGEIVLNVSDQATNRLRIGNDLVEFEARFFGCGAKRFDSHRQRLGHLRARDWPWHGV